MMLGPGSFLIDEIGKKFNVIVMVVILQYGGAPKRKEVTLTGTYTPKTCSVTYLILF